jgi:hypothetical protein
MAKRTKKSVNKSAFVRDLLQKNPEANRRAVEEAWLAAGHEGLISSALVSNTRSKLGLTGDSRTAESNGATESAKTAPRKLQGKKRGRRARGEKNGIVSEPTRERKPRSGGRYGALAEIEGDIDRLIFKLIALGDMEEIEDELRKVRRRLILSQRE